MKTIIRIKYSAERPLLLVSRERKRTMTQQHSRCSMKHLFSTCALLSALILTLLAGLLVVPTAIHADEPHQCDRHVLPVTLSPLGLTVYHVVGWLCYQGSLAQYHAVQLLVHGATYSHIYRDFTV